MKRLVLFTLMAFALAACGNPQAISYTVDPSDGHLTSLSYDGTRVALRTDEGNMGPSFEGVSIHPDGNGGFIGEKGQLRYALRYSEEPGNLVVNCSITNTDAENEYVVPLRESLILGIDCEMIKYPQWDDVLFPTLLRCEKDYCWGYFGATDGHALALVCENPVASYTLNYSDESGHRICTTSLDLLHVGPLPARHPQNLDMLSPGETRSWKIHLGAVDSMDKVQSTIADWTGIPMIECSAYTVGEGESITARVMGSRLQKASGTLRSPSGRISNLTFDRRGLCTLDSLTEKGLYTLDVTNHAHTSEASLYVRESWEWYLDAVRRYMCDVNPPLMGSSCETHYGYYPAFKAARLMPDEERDAFLRARFIENLPTIVDTLTWIPRNNCWPHRLQNWSTVTGMLVDLWKATGCRDYLEKAAKMGDYVCSHQVEDGSYRNQGNHYTCVIYPAKSIFDLADAEEEAGMAQNAHRHRESAVRACEDLRSHLDDIGTEGDQTFEDGMIACSALQLAYAGLHTDDPEERRLYAEAAETMLSKHRCLEQNIIPDCRMHGATERFWESPDIFLFSLVMNSPHGWSGWKLLAELYIYELTGRENYLREFTDALGSCVQLMDLDGKLRWAFLPDPYIEGDLCVPGDCPHTLSYKNGIVGEQYMDQISPWCRQEDEMMLTEWTQPGSEGDGTVYEIFNVLAEAIPIL